MKICRNCTLNDKIFSVHIDDDGLCNYCLRTGQAAGLSQAEIDDAENKLKVAFDAARDKPYQVLLAYSGGKDSTFTLMTLVEKYGASVLAMTFDNGFLTEQCLNNIHEVTARLGVDNLIVSPDFSKLSAIFNLASQQQIFPRKALERASSVCTACIGLIKSAAYREAINRQIPYICFGWTPGQAPVKSPIMKLDYRMILANERQIMEPIVKNLGDGYRRYFNEHEWLEQRCADIPALLYPLVFSRYNEEAVLSSIGRLGWKKPLDTDTNSTNCQLNSYANAIHLHDYGFNPYTFEIAGLVREGLLDRDEGLEKLSCCGDNEVIADVKTKLAKYAAHEIQGACV